LNLGRTVLATRCSRLPKTYIRRSQIDAPRLRTYHSQWRRCGGQSIECFRDCFQLDALGQSKRTDQPSIQAEKVKANSGIPSITGPFMPSEQATAPKAATVQGRAVVCCSVLAPVTMLNGSFE
jgi:hypothetical protein